MNDRNKYFGKYRGTVINNVDPEQRGRIQVTVADVSNLLPSSWAMPCMPIGGPQMGMFTVPLIGSSVWIEFEQGNPDYPIWTGCFWERELAAAEIPTLARIVPPAIPGIVFQTPLQNGVIVSDMPPTPATGGIVLKSATGAMIVVNDTGIYIQNGKGASIMMVGPTITINNGALVIT
jgi:hypothetical protein